MGFYDWVFFTVTLPEEPLAAGFEHTLMIRRSVTDPTEVVLLPGPCPDATPTNATAAVAGTR